MKQFNYLELPQWQQDIIQKYPSIYLEPNPALKNYFSEPEYIKLINTPGFCNLRFGFEFGEGWMELVDNFSTVIDNTLKLINNSDSKYYVKSFIFKEKFGTLRFQGHINLPNPYNHLIYAYIEYIERKSAYICELTGKFGWLCVNGGVYKTLSAEKAKELGYKALD